MLEKFGLIAKKFLFPIIIIVAGLLIVIKGASADAETNIMQTSGFLYGGLAILLMGVITLLYILEIINRIVHLVLMVILFCSTLGLGVMTINSVNDTIAEMDLKEKTDNFIKQGLSDIRDIQVEYKKKYGVYTSSFSVLKNFLLKDSIMDILRNDYSLGDIVHYKKDTTIEWKIYSTATNKGMITSKNPSGRIFCLTRINEKSILDTVLPGDIEIKTKKYPNGMPDGRVSEEHGILLGYDPIRDECTL